MIIEHTLRLAPEPASIAVARGVVTEALARAGIEPRCVEDIRLAISEACANAVLHGPSDQPYDLTFRLSAHRCAITVQDHGTDVETADLTTQLPPASAPTGRGLAIMHAVMDDVDVTADEHGTTVHLVKVFDPTGRAAPTAPTEPGQAIR